MYEKIAWENFCKTGDIESFLEYKRILKLNNEMQNLFEKKGDGISELDKSEGDSNKGNNI